MLVFDVRSHVVQIIHRVVAVAAQKVIVLIEIDYDLRVGVHRENCGCAKHLLLLLLLQLLRERARYGWCSTAARDGLFGFGAAFTTGCRFGGGLLLLLLVLLLGECVGDA